MNSCSMDVIVGTYEELILGFTITVDDDVGVYGDFRKSFDKVCNYSGY